MVVTRPFTRVSEGTRTPDRLDHNQELYQLSYAHRGASESTSELALRQRQGRSPPTWLDHPSPAGKDCGRQTICRRREVITATVEIDRTPEDVFAYLDALDRHGEWQSQIVSAKVETEGPTRVGTQVTEVRNIQG